MLTLLLAVLGAATPTAVDVERAFARDARRKGQWTTYRIYADQDAVMFTPQAEWAHNLLKGRKDPAVAPRWSPNVSYVSCDGTIAVNSGPWKSADRRASGYFTTLWQQEKGQWHWIYNGMDTLKAPVTARTTPIVRKASCRGTAPGAPLMATPSTKRGPRGEAPDDFGRGQSADRTLGWDWKVGPTGARQFRTFLWTGRGYKLALEQKTGSK